ncbi:hypothetical protein [Chromobacterium sphagni]|uniref:hypothetical protein n=1 Tax=Chromobacterium sphagni TaxID=1903179 RepID=UPI0011140AA0|nr:hypothetical protein [Chromobacterium sphagni]
MTHPNTIKAVPNRIDRHHLSIFCHTPTHKTNHPNHWQGIEDDHASAGSGGYTTALELEARLEDVVG